MRKSERYYEYFVRSRVRDAEGGKGCEKGKEREGDARGVERFEMSGGVDEGRRGEAAEGSIGGNVGASLAVAREEMKGGGETTEMQRREDEITPVGAHA